MSKKIIIEIESGIWLIRVADDKYTRTHRRQDATVFNGYGEANTALEDYQSIFGCSGAVFKELNIAPGQCRNLTILEEFTLVAARIVSPPKFKVGIEQTDRNLGKWAQKSVRMAKALIEAVETEHERQLKDRN